MPLYEYTCVCGSKFEELKSMEERHNVTCTCGLTAELMMSASVFRMATYFTTVEHDGTVIGRKQTIEQTPAYVTSSGREY